MRTRLVSCIAALLLCAWHGRAEAFTLIYTTPVAMTGSAGAPPPDTITLDAMNLSKITYEKPSASEIKVKFLGDKVGTASLDGVEYDVVTLDGSYVITLIDSGPMAEQFDPAEGELFLVESDAVTPTVIGAHVDSFNILFFDGLDNSHISRLDSVLIPAGATLTLVGGTGTPGTFTPSGDEWVNAEDMTFAVEIPEPTTAAMLMIGLCAATRRRRSKRSAA